MIIAIILFILTSLQFYWMEIPFKFGFGPLVMTLFCLWGLPCILSLKRFPKPIFYSFCPRSGNQLFSPPVTPLSFLLSCFMVLASDLCIGPAGMMASFVSRWHWRDAAGNGLLLSVSYLSAVSVGPPLGQHKNTQGPLLSLELSWLLPDSLLCSRGAWFPACQPQPPGAPMGHVPLTSVRPPAINRLRPRITWQTSPPSPRLPAILSHEVWTLVLRIHWINLYVLGFEPSVELLARRKWNACILWQAGTA